MNNWQFKALLVSALIILGVPLVEMFNSDVSYSIDAPRIVNENESGTIIVKVENNDGHEVAADIELYGAKTAKTSITFKGDFLEIPFQVKSGAPAVIYQVSLKSLKGDIQFYGRIEILGNHPVNGLYAVTDRLRYRPGDKVRILALEYEGSKGLQKKVNYRLKMVDARGNILTKKELVSEDGLLLHEIELGDKLNQGEWQLYVGNGKEEVFTKFKVEDFVPRQIDLSLVKPVECLINDQNAEIVLNASHFAGGEIDGMEVNLRMSYDKQKLWEDTSSIEKGEVRFSIPKDKFEYYSQVDLSASLKQTPENEILNVKLPVRKFSETVHLFPVDGFFIGGHENQIEVKFADSFTPDQLKAYRVEYNGNKLQTKVEGSSIKFTLREIGDSISLKKGGVALNLWDTASWYQKYSAVEVSAEENGLSGSLKWDKSVYGSDKVKIEILKGKETVTSKEYAVEGKNSLEFKIEVPFSTDHEICYTLLKNEQKLCTVQGSLANLKANEIKLQFSEKTSQPGMKVDLEGNLKYKYEGSAAVIVKDLAYSQSQSNESFQLLKSQIIPENKHKESATGLIYRNTNEEQILYQKSQREKKLYAGFKVLGISALISLFIASVLSFGRNRLGAILAFVFILFILAAMILPALGKARYKSEDAAKKGDVELSEEISQPVEVRRNFKDNLLFAKVKFDQEGHFKVPIKLADNLTTWRAEVLGFPADNSVVYGKDELVSTKDLFAEADLPVFFVKGDQTELTVNVFNKLNETGVLILETDEKIKIGGFEPGLNGKSRQQFKIPLSFTGHGDSTLRIKVQSKTNTDIQERSVRIRTGGVPVSKTKSVSLYDGESEQFTVEAIPDAIIQNNNLTFYPGSLAESIDGVEHLFREPNGCFEQTSSSNFPNIVAYNFLKTTGDLGPLAGSIKGKLERGYQRLASYEVNSGGFSLYGAYPASPWLTAYGILQFHLMSQHIFVDQNIINRSWGYLRENLNKLPEDKQLFAIYCCAQAGLIDDGVKPYCHKIAQKALKSENLWSAVLGTLILTESRDKAEIRAEMTAIMDKVLAGKGRFSAVNAGYGSTAEEAVLALAVESAFVNRLPQLYKLKKKLVNLKKEGRWQGTMSTALALKALALSENRSVKKISLTINGREEILTMDPNNSEVLQYPLSVGDRVSLKLLSGGFVSSHVSRNAELRFKNSFKESAYLEAEFKTSKKYFAGSSYPVELILKAGEEKRENPMVEMPVPAGFSIDKEYLSRLKDKGGIRHFELRSGNLLVLYLNDLKKEENLTLNVRLYASIKGKYKSVPGKFYEYYHPERKVSVNLPEVHIE